MYTLFNSRQIPTLPYICFLTLPLTLPLPLLFFRGVVFRLQTYIRCLLTKKGFYLTFEFFKSCITVLLLTTYYLLPTTYYIVLSTYLKEHSIYV